MLDLADRLGVAVRPGAGHLVKRQLGSGGDHQEVIGQAAAIGQFHRIALGINALHLLGHKLDALALQMRPQCKGDGVALTPAHRQPGVGRHELEVVHRVDDGDGVVAVEQAAQFIGRGHAANTRAEDDDVRHG